VAGTGAITTLTVGECTLTATRAADANYLVSATSASQSFVVAQGTQAITFGALSDKVLADAPFEVSASASSGLAVSFAATVESAGVCMVSGTTVTLIGTGTCTVTASQAGNANYLAAPNVVQAFAVNP